MDFNRFRKIIEYDNNNHTELVQKAKDFYCQMGIDYDNDILNLGMIIKQLFDKKKYLLIEIPLKDKEIGAICYKSGKYGYAIMNSALPRVNVNFAMAHEIYHLFYQKTLVQKKVELYANEHYYEHEEEYAANNFAGKLIMPTKVFANAYERFSREMSAGDSYLTIVVKLMNFFKAPYMAVVIRLYELGLFPDGTVLKELLAVGQNQILDEFNRLWLEDTILYPSQKNDYEKLEFLVKAKGALCVERDIMGEGNVKNIISNMRRIYEKVRG